MALSTAFTSLFPVRHPITLAPMGGSAGGALAAAVSNAGGLGLLGAGDGDPAWLDRELPIVTARTDRPWGIGFQTWSVTADRIGHALEHRPAAVMLSFGDPAEYIDPIRASGARLILQVTDLAEARRAIELEPDVLVVQGTESGGHGARQGRSTLSFVPVAADLAGPIPVLAAGGIGDGRGIAAALTLGAAGVLIGTRFQATAEALVDPETSKALLAGRGEDTERNTLLDLVRGSAWPSHYPARTLGHPMLDEWRDREAELAGRLQAVQRDYADGVADGTLPPSPVWAGEILDLITDLPPAADLVTRLVTEAATALHRAWSFVGEPAGH